MKTKSSVVLPVKIKAVAGSDVARARKRKSAASMAGRVLASPTSQVVAVIESIRAGLPKAKITTLAEKLGLTQTRLLESVGLVPRTLRNREERLTPVEGERLLRVEQVFDEAVRILGSEERARKWITTPAYGLGNLKPLDFLDTDIGTQEVLSLLSAIEYGDYF